METIGATPLDIEGLARFWAYQRQPGVGARFYLGTTTDGLVLAGPQQAALVLGPPRSGKTTTVVVPNVLGAPGAVVSASTKPEVMVATAPTRARLGRCWLFDPTGTTPTPPGVTRIGWTPVAACGTWDEALLTARAMTSAARPGPRAGAEGGHWLERAEAMLAPLLHAAALTGADMGQVQAWVLRHDLTPARAVLGARGVTLGADVLAGLAVTDHREQSGIFSTAAGVLAAYRSTAVLDAARPANFDPRGLAATTDTVYVCAPAREQELVAPIIVGFVESVRAGAYAAARQGPGPGSGTGPDPVTFVLDEVANIAPLPGLPALVSEGGGQGVTTLACLQDLSQARQRWGGAADGMMSLFGAKVVLPGIGDLPTLELVSRLGGELDVPVRSRSRGPWWAGRSAAGHETWAPHRQRRIPVDAVHTQPPGTALLLAGAAPPTQVALAAWWDQAPFADARPAPALPAPGTDQHRPAVTTADLVPPRWPAPVPPPSPPPAPACPEPDGGGATPAPW